MITPISIFPTTNNASSSQFSIPIWLFCYWKKMIVYTMSLFSIDCRWARASKHIQFLWYKFQMLWITARFIITKMVKDWDFFSIFRSWNFTYCSHNKTMHSISIFLVAEKTISKFVFCAKPIPAFRRFIDQYFGKETLFIFFSQKDFKVFHY